MPKDFPTFYWVLSIALIGVLLTIIAFFIKDKLNTIIKQLEKFEQSIIKLFEENTEKIKDIEEIKGELKVIKIEVSHIVNNGCANKCGVKNEKN